MEHWWKKVETSGRIGVEIIYAYNIIIITIIISIIIDSYNNQ